MRAANPNGMPCPGAMIVQTRLIRDIADLRQPVKGADVAVSQIEGGQLTGSATHGLLGTFSVSLGHFSKAVRLHGIDRGAPVDFTYKMPFAFTGKLDRVTVDLK